MAEKIQKKKIIPKVRWYIIQTYQGQEKAVMEDLKTRIKSLNMGEYIHQVIVPEAKRIDKVDKKGSPGVKEDKEVIYQIYPGYIFVEMEVTDESWYIVRNTPKVTGFLGSSGGGTKPVPLQDDEIDPILKQMGLIDKPDLNQLVGKTVTIISGNFGGLKVVVDSVDNDKELVFAYLDLFGQSVLTPIPFDDVKLSE